MDSCELGIELKRERQIIMNLSYKFDESPYLENSLPHMNPLTPEEIHTLQSTNEADLTEHKLSELSQYSYKLRSRAMSLSIGFLFVMVICVLIGKGFIFTLPLFLALLAIEYKHRLTEKYIARKIQVLSGELLDCTTPASVPSFIKHLNNSSEPVYSVVRRALTIHLPDWLNSPSRSEKPLSPSVIISCLSNQTAYQFPKLACLMLDRIDSAQSLELLPVITEFMVRRRSMQARREVVEAAEAAYHRLTSGICYKTISNTKLANWIQALNQHSDRHLTIGNIHQSPDIRDWSTYIIAREEFSRLYHLVTEEQVRIIPEIHRKRLYSTIEVMYPTFHDRNHQLDKLGDAFYFAIIAFAKNSRDLLASEPFRKIQCMDYISHKVKKEALECANYLDDVRENVIGRQTLLRSSERSASEAELLKASENLPDDTALLRVTETNP